MDDLDEFLENITVTPSADRRVSMETDEDFMAFLDTPSGFSKPVDGSTGASGEFSLTTQSVDDSQDFLDWLQESSSRKEGNTSQSNLPAISEQDEAPYSPNTSFRKTRSEEDGNDSNEDATAAMARTPSVGSTKEVSKDMDNFFNEVFGSPSPSNKSSSRKLFNHNNNSSQNDDFGDLQRENSTEELSYEELVQSIVTSSFPDIHQLRRIVLQAGYVPATLRAQVWSLLIHESCSEDGEIGSYSAEGVQFENSTQLTADIAALLSQQQTTSTPTTTSTSTTTTTTPSSPNNTALQKDMQDILFLYCQRRQIPYNSVLCTLLGTLLLVPDRAKRGVASSCFYALASDFLPLANLSPAAHTLSVTITHKWLRMLLTYHSPALVHHLDRVLPHWEEPAAEMSTHQSAVIAATHKHSSDLDELEKELGLDLLDSATTASSHLASANVDSGSIESALPIREQAHSHTNHSNSNNNSNNNNKNRDSTGSTHSAQSGVVPTHWITGIFTGSLPPIQAAMMVDYAVLTDCNFAGLYFSAALLHIYSESLLKMSGPRIRTWFEEIALNKSEWYKNTPVSMPVNSSGGSGSDGNNGSSGSSSGVPKDWQCFMNGWIHCTTALIRSTPQSFKNSLSQIAEWATVKAEYRNNVHVHNMMKQRRANKTASSELDKISHGTNNLSSGDINPSVDATKTSSSVHESDGESENESFAGDTDDDYLSDNTESSNTNNKNNKLNFMAQFRRFSSQFNPEQAEKDALLTTQGQKLSSFAHEKLFLGTHAAPICLTASVEEVIPCICSNRRRAVAPDDLIQCFYNEAFPTATATTISTDKSSVYARFSSAAEAENKPFYFGIDCRSASERSLGQFPKAYAFDPVLLTDSDEVVKLLEMVGTMAASAHLCLIGCGEGYLRWAHTTTTNSRRLLSTDNTSTDLLNQSIEESNAKLNAVAMFFLKKSFKHVSILEGGFMAAAQYLHLPDSPLSLTAALVDSDRGALESLLGIAAPTTAAKRESLVSYLPDVSGSKLLSVTSYFSKAANSSSSGGISGGGINSSNNTSSNNLTAMNDSSSSSDNNTTTTNTTSTTTTPTNTTSTTTPTTTNTPTPTPTTIEAPSVLSTWGKKLSLFSTSSLETIKKSVAAVSSVQDTNNANTNNSGVSGSGVNPSASTDDYEDDGMGPREFADTTSINISRTDREREQALSMHRMAGLRKGDRCMINRADLPGAILFPSIKYKEVRAEVVGNSSSGMVESSSGGIVSGDGVGDSNDTTNTTTATTTSTTEPSLLDNSNSNDTTTTTTATTATTTANTTSVVQQVQVHRYLVVSRERFLVLDASGGGVGSEATVKSNRHLTELMKMTFKKKDPELVTLYFVTPDNPNGKARQYRVSKRAEFVSALQKNMERFK